MEPFSPEHLLREAVGGLPAGSRGGVRMALRGDLPSAVRADHAGWLRALVAAAGPGEWSAAMTGISGEGSLQITYTLGGEVVTFVAEVARPGPPAAPRALPPGLRVLVADDDPAARELLRAILEAAGARIQAVADGAQAVEASAEVAFDLMLFDMHMPLLDGPDAARLLRSRGVTVPILAVTANTAPEDRRECVEAGMNDVVHKPIRRADVLAVAGVWAG